MNTESMRRGAREANEESMASAMGAAIGNLTVFISAITDLKARVEKLERVHEPEADRHVGGIVISLRPSEASKLSPETRRALEEMVRIAYEKLTSEPSAEAPAQSAPHPPESTQPKEAMP